MNKLHIAEREISLAQPPYVIAEISGNHNGQLDKAIKLLEIAKEAGADAVKIQTYTADTMTIDCEKADFLIHDGLWDGYSLYKLYQWAYTPWEWHEALFQRAHDLGITLFSTPFDETSVDFLEKLNAPAYKIASFEAIDIPLIKKVAAQTKPVILSTGMANAKEITAAIETLRNGGVSDLAVLHCVSGYPTPLVDTNLSTIQDLTQRFNVVSGLSDHTLGNLTAVVGVGLGACVIEKHITLDRQEPGPDVAFSLEPDEFTQLCRDVRLAWQAKGQVNYELKNSEKSNLRFRRSIYVVKDMQAGEVFTRDNLRVIRPGFGMLPEHYETILGTTASCNIERGSALNPAMLSLNLDLVQA